MFWSSALSFVGSLSSAVLIGVSMAPGAILLIVIPNGASSMERLRVIIFRPPLLAQYAVKWGKGRSSWTELMLMIFPEALRPWRCFTKACVAKNGPLRFVLGRNHNRVR